MYCVCKKVRKLMMASALWIRQDFLTVSANLIDANRFNVRLMFSSSYLGKFWTWFESTVTSVTVGITRKFNWNIRYCHTAHTTVRPVRRKPTPPSAAVTQRSVPLSRLHSSGGDRKVSDAERLPSLRGNEDGAELDDTEDQTGMLGSPGNI